MDFSRGSAGLSIFRFHFNVGIRLAAKILAPVLALAFASVYIFKLEFFLVLVQAVFVDSYVLISGLFLSAIAIVASRVISFRILSGLSGWIRHLPISSRVQRRMAGLSIFIAGFPVLLALVFLVLLLSINLGIDPSVYLLGLPVLGLASSFFVLPTQKAVVSKSTAFLSCLLATSGHGNLLGLGLVLVLLTDRISGPLFVKRRHRYNRMTVNGVGLVFFLSWRSLRLRLIFAYLSAVFVFGLTKIFLLNNAFSPPLAAKVILFGGAAGLSIFCAVLAHELSVRRPSWPWSRSLPWSSGFRILMDAVFLGLHVFPLFLFISLLGIRPVVPIFLGFPALLVYSALEMRTGANFRTGAYGRIIVFGILGSLALSLWPWLSLLFLSLTPLLFKWAAKKERNLKVSRWLERHYIAEGDSLSWSQK
jgi:hypothetical protein